MSETPDVIKIGIEAGVSELLRPLTGLVGNVVGLSGGDWLESVRKSNRKRLGLGAEAHLREAGVMEPAQPSPSVLLPILSGADNEGRDAVADLWARLLAAAMDPARADKVTRKMIQTVNDIEPLDTILFPLVDGERSHDTPIEYLLAEDLSAPASAVQVSLLHLLELGLIYDRQNAREGSQHMVRRPTHTPYGVEFLRVMYG